MRMLKKVILILFVILIAIFAVQNSQSITLELFNWSANLPASVVIILVYIFGMTTGGILFSILKRLAGPEKIKSKSNYNPEA